MKINVVFISMDNIYGWKLGYYIYQDKIVHVVYVTKHTFAYVLYNSDKQKIREERTSRKGYVNAGLFQFVSPTSTFKKEV
jgi:hypothetical protein